MAEVSVWEIAGASAKGIVRSLIAKFVPSGSVAGVPLADLATIALAWYLSKKLYGNWREFFRGLFIKSVGDVLESYIKGAILGIASSGREVSVEAYAPYEVV